MSKSGISIEYLQSYPCIKVNFLMARLVRLFLNFFISFFKSIVLEIGKKMFF